MIYLITFAISVLFAYLATRVKKDTVWSKVLFYICAAISILIPAILAGLRAPNIGTDVTQYVSYDFQIAKMKPNIVDFYGAGKFLASNKNSSQHKE